MKLSPICLFTYNRLDETKKTIQALQKNLQANESDLYIFSDGVKNKEEELKVNEVREFLKTVDGFKKIKIYESEVNQGLAVSIISGVSKIIKKHGSVIVLEDDLITSPNFLTFMNKGLCFYQNDDKIQSINGFSLYLKSCKKDVYFQSRTFSWGWATWEEKWRIEIFDKKRIREKLEIDKKAKEQLDKFMGRDFYKMLTDSLSGINNSWYVRWAYNHFESDTLAVYPSKSLVKNIGFSDEGTHCKEINSYHSIFDSRTKFSIVFNEYKNKDELLEKEFLKYFSIIHKIKIRFNLILTREGRSLLLKEMYRKIKK